MSRLSRSFNSPRTLAKCRWFHQEAVVKTRTEESGVGAPFLARFRLGSGKSDAGKLRRSQTSVRVQTPLRWHYPSRQHILIRDPDSHLHMRVEKTAVNSKDRRQASYYTRHQTSAAAQGRKHRCVGAVNSRKHSSPQGQSELISGSSPSSEQVAGFEPGHSSWEI